MPTLNWIGKEAVVKHHKEVPFRLWERCRSCLVAKMKAAIAASRG